MASSSTVDCISPDPSLQSLLEREKFLQAWTSNSCSNESVISLEEGWDILDRYGIKMIEKSLISNSSSELPMGTKGFASLYTISYKLSTSEKIDIEDFSKVLYDRCKQSVENYIRTNIISKLAGISGIEFLKIFLDGWKKHKLLTSWMWRLFMNLDKTVVRTEALPTITSSCLKCFYELVFSQYLVVLRRGLLDCTAMDREGTLLDNSILKEVIEIFVVMGLVTTSDSLVNLDEAFSRPQELVVYITQFETFLIDETEKYYGNQAKSLWHDVDSVTDFDAYLRDTTVAVAREERLADNCLHPTTKQKLIKACLSELVVQTSKTITFYNKLVFRSLKDNVMVESLLLSESQRTLLTRMYYLYNLTFKQHPESAVFNFFEDCSAEFNMYIISLGDQIIMKRSVQQSAINKQLQSNASDISTPSSSSLHSAKSVSPYLNDMDISQCDQSTSSLAKPVASKSALPVTACQSNTPNKQPSVVDADTEFVENSLRLYEHGSFIVKSLFNNHPSFERALKDGINHFVNRDSTSITCFPTTSIEAREEKVEGQCSVRRMIRRHRKRMTGSSKQIGNKYGRFSIDKMDEEDMDEMCSDSEDCSDSGGCSRSDTSESAARPSKIARRVSWAGSGSGSGSGSGMQIVKEGPGQGLASATDANPASFLRAAASSSSSSSATSLSPGSSTTSLQPQALSSSSSSTSSAFSAAASQVAMLASYCDKLLKGGTKQGGDSLESTLERCVSLFGHMSDKDLFAQLYRDALSRRLLNKKSKCNDAERLVITRMKAECGGAYTSKLEGMLNDFILADVMNKDFQPDFAAWRDKEDNQELKDISFGVQVLSLGHWPSQKMKEAVLPPSLESCKIFFMGWYSKVHSHRTLKWILTLGEAVVCAQYGQRSYDLQVSTLQAVVLQAFDNNTSTQSFNALQQVTGITDLEVLKRLLHSLSCQKFKVLLKSPQGKSVSPSDSFSVNQGFSHAVKKFRVPMAFLEDTEPVLKNIEIERGTTIDAAVVRIMKTRKICNHVQLVGDILQHLSSFIPDPKLVKQRIEMLIEKEYLKRDIGDNKTYHYMP